MFHNHEPLSMINYLINNHQPRSIVHNCGKKIELTIVDPYESGLLVQGSCHPNVHVHGLPSGPPCAPGALGTQHCWASGGEQRKRARSGGHPSTSEATVRVIISYYGYNIGMVIIKGYY